LNNLGLILLCLNLAGIFFCIIMLKRFQNLIQKSPLLQVTGFNSFSIVVKLISSLVVSKVTAVFLGTQGITFIGNLRNALSVLQNFSTGGLNKAVVKYSSEHKERPEYYTVFISTLFWVFIILSILIFLGVYVFSEILANYVFGNQDYTYIFRWLAVLLPLYGLNTFLIAILQGLEQFKRVIKINIFIHILNLLVFGFSVYQFGLSGALMAVIAVPSISLLISLSLAGKYLKVGCYFNYRVFSKQQLKYFGQYAFMTLISAVSFPLVYLGIRQHILESISIDDAGYWEANFRLSNFYLIFIQSLLSLYILPKFVQAKSKAEFRAIVLDFYKQIIPLFGVGLFILFLLRKYLVLVVFSEEFLPVTSILGWQMVADFFRVLALVMVYQFHAKKMLWHYIITDIILAVGLYFSAVIGVKYLALSGVVIGHVIIYLVYFLLILFIFRKSIFKLKVT